MFAEDCLKNLEKGCEGLRVEEKKANQKTQVWPALGSIGVRNDVAKVQVSEKNVGRQT
jgi:hypothetical protein